MKVPNWALFSLIRVVCYMYIFPWKIQYWKQNVVRVYPMHTYTHMGGYSSDLRTHVHKFMRAHSHTMDCCVLCIQTCVKVWLTIGRHYLVVMIFYCNFVAQTRSASGALPLCTVLFQERSQTVLFQERSQTVLCLEQKCYYSGTSLNSLGPKFSSQSFSLSTTLKRTPVSVFSACQAQNCSQR